jgi:hypothetical protein
MKRIPSLLNSSHLRKVTAYLLVYSVINAPVWAITMRPRQRLPALPRLG